MRFSENLRALPQIRFTPAAPSRFYIKRQPKAHCVSTIEAVHYLLDRLESQGLEELKGRHNTLIEAIDSLVEYQKRFVPTDPKIPRRA
jgi:DTW domain-containing protein YfiP